MLDGFNKAGLSSNKENLVRKGITSLEGVLKSVIEQESTNT